MAAATGSVCWMLKRFPDIAHLLGVLLATLAMAGILGTRPAWAYEEDDSLYLSDLGDNSVKRYDAKTGTYLGTFVAPGDAGLLGPQGLVFIGRKLYVANQNLGADYAGEIIRFDKRGDFINALVPCNPPQGRECDPNAPFAPHGLIRGIGNTVYVADFNVEGGAGRVAKYDSRTGAFLGNLDPTGFKPPFLPRGIVLGPDGLLYVSLSGDLVEGDQGSGYVLRFNPISGKFVDVFASHEGKGCAADLHRPEGLVFGPDGKLYLVGFRADKNDTDKLLVFDRRGRCVDKIDLYPPGQPRTYGQALLFGPKGRLFLPIITTGEVRRYDVKKKTYDVFVPAGGSLLAPSFLSFGNTDPTTLEYDE
jgi:DNA-binding beta-propeller fold protein YncE